MQAKQRVNWLMPSQNGHSNPHNTQKINEKI